MSGPFIYSRRRFLQQTGAFSALSLAASMDKLGLAGAAAQAPGYKALVCVFLFGGNDANNTVLPYTDYAEYFASRSTATGINIPQTGAGSMLTINPANTFGKIYGLHPLLPELRLLFNSGKMAVVANYGPLVEPVTRAQYIAAGHAGKKVPVNLFSHSDQQQQFMTSVSQSTLGGITGWGGRLADKVVGMNAASATPMSMSFAGLQTFGNGVAVKTLALPTGGNFGFSGDGTSAQQLARSAARSALLRSPDASPMVGAAQTTMGVALDSSVKLNPIIQAAVPAGSPIGLAFAGLTGGLVNQLRTVAKIIEQRATLGHQREIFFVSIGGFDTHGNQVTSHTNLLPQVSRAINAFYQATVNMGIANNVTTFTMSDFSRTMKPNGSGTDHAWGTHGFVVGGSVLGNNFYGTPDLSGFVYPNLYMGNLGVNDSGNQGRWIPTTAIEQYGATLAKWFGASPTDIAQIFPKLGNFATPDLGFLV